MCELQVMMRLTERSLHVIGRTSLGIPDQLCFRSSSVPAQIKIMLSTQLYLTENPGERQQFLYSVI